ncbi:MAG TPA: LytTR family DNA-binding domain-containing protein, partial [Pyrinomonadaceae bacterium]|nr:LytTR family DNA-binding domain-containing protein [Pyrinomonadaceae bacterium]
ITRFTQALERVREQLQSSKTAQLSRRLASLLDAHEQERGRERIVVQTARGKLLLYADAVDWIEADDYYSAIHAGGARHLIRESLASLEERLSQKLFLRPHRSAIVNIDRVCELRKDGGESFLVLTNGVRIPISRRRRARVTRTLRRLK